MSPRIIANRIAAMIVAMIAIAFLWWAFGWKAALGWVLIQTYANLRFAKE